MWHRFSHCSDNSEITRNAQLATPDNEWDAEASDQLCVLAICCLRVIIETQETNTEYVLLGTENEENKKDDK